MAWTSPKTYAAGAILTAAELNTYQRDNLNWMANDRPRARAFRTGNQSIPTSTDTALTFATETFDVGDMHDNVSNTSRLTVPAGGGGLYLIGGNYRMDATGTQRRITILRLNGTTDLATNVYDAAVSSGADGDVITTLYPLVATNYVEIFVNQNTGAPINAFDTALWAIWQTF